MGINLISRITISTLGLIGRKGLIVSRCLS